MKRKIYYILLLLLTVTQGALAQGITVSEDPESTFVPTTIVNGSFDDEPWMVFTYGGVTYNTCKDDTGFDTTSKDNEDGYAQNVVFNGVNGGWNTTDRSIWRSSLFEYTNSVDGTHNHQHNSSIPQTDKYVEMNNYHSCMLYQDLRTNSHDVIRWTLKHAVTPAGDEYQPIRVEIGAPNLDGGGNIINASGWASDLNPQINLDTKAIYRYDGVTDKNGNASTIGFGSETDLQYLRLHNTATDQQEGWWMAQGVYAIPEGQTVTRFGFISEANKQNQGNLLDDLTFSTLIGNLSAQQLANNDVEVKGYWGETDASKRFKVVIDGTTHDINMSSVVGKNFRIIIPAAIVGTATSVEAYHSDYKVAENTIAVRPVYSSTLQSSTTDASNWSITPPVAEVGTTIDVTYSGSLRPASVATIPVASTWTMEYTGAIQTFTAPATGEYELQVWGAQGGNRTHTNNAFAAGGKGGYATCHTNLTAGETIYVYVGGQGGTVVSDSNLPAGAGGWNGGGAGGNGASGHSGSAGGGGATHISKVNNQIIGNGCNFLGGTDYIIVAGGGGGAGHNVTTAGAGGGTTGGYGTYYTSTDPHTEEQYSTNWYYNDSDSRGARGGHGLVNGSTSCEGSGGGGGGYLGGTANVPYDTFTEAYQDAGGCGGNSAYNSSLATNFSTEAGQRSGNGKAEIRLISITEAPTPTAATEVGDNHWQYTIPNYNVEVQVDYHEYPGTGTENDPYIIASTEDWNNLADKVNAGKNYAGKFFRQTQDISVTTMIGVPYSLKFSGTYDGYGHTLTVTYNTTAEAAGPFRYIYGATIKNLHTAGTITTTGWYAGGFVGIAHGANTFFNCRSSVTINSNLDGDGSHGGFIGHLLSPSANTITSFEGCVFDGSFNSSNTSCWGGYIGWSDSDAGARLSLVNCLFAPQEVTINAATGPSGAQTFTRAPDPVGVFSTLTNTYYTEYLTNIQAKKAYFITGANGATVANAGTKTEYNVSGITSYGTGIKFGDTFYAGNGDEVSLALSHADAAEGYAFGGYEASSGTLSGSDNPYTLTMSSSDVTISATWKKILTNANITIESVAYDGNSHTAVVKCGETNLVKGTDYTVTGTDALTNVGSTTFTITGTGDYTGDVADLTFTIYRNFAFTNSDWMTWYGAEDLTVTPSEMETYVVKGVTSTTITIESTEGKIYLNKPMLLKRVGSDPVNVHGYAPAASLTPPTGLSDDYIGGKETFDGYTDGTVYVLAGSEFVRARVTSNTPFNPSKCFICLKPDNANNSRLIIIGDGPTGINPVVTDGVNDTWYTINGFKLSKRPTRAGMYIQNGRKVVVKN